MTSLPTDAALHAAILRSAVFPCIATDAEGLIRVFNVGAERLLKYAAADVIGLRRFSELCAVPELTARTRSTEEAFDLMLVRGDGLRLPVTLSVSALTDPDGEVIGYLLLAGDNRARTERDAQLRQANKLEAIGTLAAGVAHDFNNILATILGNAELARQDAAGNAAVLECVAAIQRAGTRGRELVQQILSFSRREEADLQAVQLAPLVAESARLLRATLPGRLSVEVDCAPDLPPIAAVGSQIMQVIINLATNALQAMPSGRGSLLIRVAAVPASGGRALPTARQREYLGRHPEGLVSIQVRDTGCGMDPAVLSRIFDPFFTTRLPGEGTGLGLSVVHGIMQSHHGLIDVHSTPGEGSTFTLLFPVSAPALAEPLVAAIEQSVPPTSNVQGLRVLYVDDEEALVSLVTRVLSRRGYQVTASTDARQALDRLRAAPADFDLVLTDYNMPMTSGLDVAREVRALRADLPVVITTGYVDDSLRAQAAAIGVREVLFKADTVDAFCDALQRIADSIPQGKTGHGN